jgi:hypothetical protein
MPSDNQEDGFEFARKMWGNMGFGLPSMVTPTLDTDELERRIKDLQAVEGWLKMNLGMLQMTIQGLEVQRSTLVAMRAMQQAGTEGEGTNNPFANPALWAWPFSQAATPTEPADPPSPPTPKTPDTAADNPASQNTTRRKS